MGRKEVWLGQDRLEPLAPGLSRPGNRATDGRGDVPHGLRGASDLEWTEKEQHTR
jgi:hypothetical protein